MYNNITLTEGERVVNSWDYAKVTTGRLLAKETIEYSITLTNKRLIATGDSKKTIMRDEVPIDEARAITAQAIGGESIWLWVKFILSLFVPIIGWFFWAPKLWKQLHACAFSLVVLRDGGVYSPLLSVGRNNLQSTKPSLFTRLFGAKKPRIVVDKQQAVQIIDQVAAAVAANMDLLVAAVADKINRSAT